MVDKITGEFKMDKETPGTWRFKSTDPDSYVDTIYVKKGAKLKDASKATLKVVITVE